MLDMRRQPRDTARAVEAAWSCRRGAGSIRLAAVEELREKIRKALAAKSKGTGAGGGKGGGDKPGTGGKQVGDAGKPDKAAQDQPTAGANDHATEPPVGTKTKAKGVFPFVIVSGMTAASQLKKGDTVTCSIKITDSGRVFVLDGVSITFVSRTDAPVKGSNQTDTTFMLYFTRDFWSEKYKFHGLGGESVQIEYRFQRHK